MKREEREDAIAFFEEVAKKEVNNAKYSKLAIEALKQEPCEDCVSRKFMYELGAMCIAVRDKTDKLIALGTIENLPSVTPKPKTGHCKECKYFKRDLMVIVDGIPLIGAHNICSKWGNGCKTKDDGYCYLFEPQESEE